MSDSDLLDDDEIDDLKRYHISASKNSYVGVSFASLEEAVEKIRQLASDGYSSVTFRDNEGEDVWL